MIYKAWLDNHVGILPLNCTIKWRTIKNYFNLYFFVKFQYQSMIIIGHLYVCYWYRCYLYFYNFSNGLWNCSHNVILFCFSIYYKLTQSVRCWWIFSQMKGHKVVYKVHVFVFVPSITIRLYKFLCFNRYLYWHLMM
jgi:hypothetical protein